MFCLYPHQTALRGTGFRGDRWCRTGYRPARAVLAGTVETAVNACWDARPLIGDRITVVGAGMVGCCLARGAGRAARRTGDAGRRRRLPRRRGRRARASSSRAPDEAPDGRDLVFHASATADGLALALRLLRPEGEVIDLSWYGDAPVRLPLGEGFHSGRLTIRSSQVGAVAPSPPRPPQHAPTGWRWPSTLLRDEAFDALLSGESTLRRAAAGAARTGLGRVVGALPRHQLRRRGRNRCSR